MSGYLYGGYMGLYRDNGKENGNYCSILGLYWGYIMYVNNPYIGPQSL